MASVHHAHPGTAQLLYDAVASTCNSAFKGKGLVTLEK
jgi:hypothetical protein